MIYLDNAATTFPKPLSVKNAVNNSFLYSANPGRAGHSMSIKAAQTLFDCRNNICRLFNFDKPENVILTPGCTFALNTVIKGVLNKGDHVVISSLEHNSVSRPLEMLREKGIISYNVAKVYEKDPDKTIDSFRNALRDNTKLVVCTHASNVFGIKLPVSRIGALCRYYGTLFCVDAAQTAGACDINIKALGADFICVPGHKGLYGPMGTGFLIINSDNIPESIIDGGTGSGSGDLKQPQMLPDKFESGTHNLHGFAGLTQGIDFVMKKSPLRIAQHEMRLTRRLYNELKSIKDVVLYTDEPENDHYVPLLSFNLDEVDPERVAMYLDKRFGIAVRAGLHCSPLAHRAFGTESVGTVRVCPSVFSTDYEIKKLIDAVFLLSKNKKISI
ncbi:MAG: aminotransferase class V-fold PLP-dependent enzyme [Ruminococcus sp.]|nr:aminotransferase class V-fold PLP-dependent enzyme [Ruminococcus sp.]